MGVTVSNVMIVQCTIFRWNPWNTNWIRRVWSRGAANFETWCIYIISHYIMSHICWVFITHIFICYWL